VAAQAVALAAHRFPWRAGCRRGASDPLAGGGNGWSPGRADRSPSGGIQGCRAALLDPHRSGAPVTMTT